MLPQSLALGDLSPAQETSCPNLSLEKEGESLSPLNFAPTPALVLVAQTRIVPWGHSGDMVPGARHLGCLPPASSH